MVEIYEDTVRFIPGIGDRLPPQQTLLKVLILKDGIHRTALARELGETIRVVIISGADRRVLPYAYPNQWSQVRIYDEKPKFKKFYRRPDPYTLMRPLKVLRQVGEAPPPSQWNR